VIERVSLSWRVCNCDTALDVNGLLTSAVLARAVLARVAMVLSFPGPVDESFGAG
jgi:hypothetical protein